MVLTTASGDVWAVGRGRNGQLGRASETESVAAYRDTPVKVTSLSQLSGGYGAASGKKKTQQRAVVAVACGSDHTMAIAR